MAFKKKDRSTEELIDEKLNSSSLKRRSSINLTKPLDETLPPIRISGEVKTFLETHFKEKGTQLSNGIRMIIHDYVKKNI